jgi:predicted  nucleic acid-binding Zn-ribbon protein
MKEFIKKTARFFSTKPIIGRPVQILAAIIRLPKIKNMVFEMSLNIQDINHRINDISDKVDETNRQIERHINEINNQIKDINKHQLDFDTQYLPDLLESLNYQENLKKSLPVVLRAHHRCIKNIDG